MANPFEGDYYGTSNFFVGKSIDAAREESRRAAIERFETQKRLRAEQVVRNQQEREAARKPPHEEMRETVAELRRKVGELQPGDPRAVALMRSYMLQFLPVAEYLLNITEPAE